MHVYVEFALSVGIRYCSVHTPPRGIPFTACMFMWSSHCQWAYGTVQCIHLHVVFRSLHACLCGVRTVSGHTVLFSAYTSTWYSVPPCLCGVRGIPCIHLHVVFRSLHACLCGFCAVHGITFTCGTGFVHDMSSCGPGFVHDTCRHAVLCTVHSMHVHVEFCIVSGHVIQVLFMTHVAMQYFALFTPCTCMWNFVLSVGVCGTVELLFKDHLENKEKMRSYGTGEACDSFSWKCQGNFSILKKKKKKGVWGG